MNKKGISPLIATVLIIGFTILAAILVINWINDLIGGQTDIQQCQSDAASQCTDYVNLMQYSATQVDDITGNPAPDSIDVKINHLAKNDPDMVMVFLDASGNTLHLVEGATFTNKEYADNFDNTDISGWADVTDVKFLVRASAVYKGEDCNVACGAGTTIGVTEFVAP
jgi:flagellin-like protein